jgi:hypothetical protein
VESGVRGGIGRAWQERRYLEGLGEVVAMHSCRVLVHVDGGPRVATEKYEVRYPLLVLASGICFG